MENIWFSMSGQHSNHWLVNKIHTSDEDALNFLRAVVRTGATGAIAPVDFKKGLIAPVDFEDKFQISIGRISANFGPRELKFGLQRWEWNSWPEFAIIFVILSKNSRVLILGYSR